MIYVDPEIIEKSYEEMPYIVSMVPDSIMYRYQRGKVLWYVHDRAVPNAPIPGSVGSRRKAERIAKKLNRAATR